MKRLVVILIGACALLASCGKEGERPQALELARADIARLAKTTGALAGLVSSNYATCAASGDTTDALLKKICQVAQAATVEVRAELKGELAAFAGMLQSQIDSLSANLADDQATLASVQASITTINSQITSLTTRMTSAESAITALQALTAPNVFPIEVGVENAGAGPAYESVLRQNDKKRFTGYAELTGYPLGLPNNPFTSTAGSANLTITLVNTTVTISIGTPAQITWTAFPFAVGAPIRFTTTGTLPTGITAGSIYYVQSAVNANTFTISATSGGAAIITSGAQAGTHTGTITDFAVGDRVSIEAESAEPGGFNSGELRLGGTVASIAGASFVLTMPRAATASSAGIGGTVAVAQKKNGKGLQTLWSSGQASDTQVRTTNLGTKLYNYIIRRIASDATNNTAELCYDKTNNAATFATINAAAEGGSGNIACK